MFEVGRLPGDYGFGAVVTGLTVDDLDDLGVREALYDLWIDKGVLVFKHVQGGRDAQLRLSDVFGETVLHPVVAGRIPGAEKLIFLKNKPASGDIYRVDGEIRAGHLPWHSDLCYVPEINRGGILRMTKIPSAFGYTGFIDQIAAYETLAEEIKERIEDLEVIYQLDFDASHKKFGKARIETIRLNPIAADLATKLDRYSPVVHPMVYRQAETGRKVLNVSPWFATGIYGMENAEGDALLERVVNHIEADSGAYYHHWEIGDMVLWDNWRMLHSAFGIPEGAEREVERSTIKGDYGLGRFVAGAAADVPDNAPEI